MTHQLDTPPQNCRANVLIFSQSLTFENLSRVNDRHATVKFSSWDIVLEILRENKLQCRARDRVNAAHLLKPSSCFGWHILVVTARYELIADNVPAIFELGTTSCFGGHVRWVEMDGNQDNDWIRI